MVNHSYSPPTVELSAEQRQQVDDALRTLQDLKPVLEKVSACGVDCSGYDALRTEMRHRLEAVKLHFGIRDPAILS